MKIKNKSIFQSKMEVFFFVRTIEDFMKVKWSNSLNLISPNVFQAFKTCLSWTSTAVFNNSKPHVN